MEMTFNVHNLLIFTGKHSHASPWASGQPCVITKLEEQGFWRGRRMWKRFMRNVCSGHRAAHFMRPSWVHSITLRCPMGMLRFSSHSSQRGARISLRPSDSKVHAVTSNDVGERVNGCNPFGGQFGGQSLKKLGLAGCLVVRVSLVEATN